MTASNGAASSNVSHAGMSSANCGHMHPEENGEGNMALRQPMSGESLWGPRGSSSQASFMTNPNYRIIPPSTGVSSSNSRGAAEGGKALRQAQSAVAAGLPTWISSSSASSGQSKTYFPAASPIIDGGGSFSADNGIYSEGPASCHHSVPTDTGKDRMQVDDDGGAMQELRTEYDLLPYEVCDWSSHLANFLPNNILVDRPHDQASRWSTLVNNHRQYIVLRLERPALVRSIKFGKFYKTHVCNLKEFKVYGGLTQENMVELLYSGLRNDSEPEIISLRQKLNGCYIPCQYIKIQPLLAHDQKFNFSIWHVELHGTMHPQIMQSIMADFNRLKEREAVRSCLKLFRNQSYAGAFDALQRQTDVRLEAPILTEIYQALVEYRDYGRVEDLLCQAEREGLFSSCMGKIPYAAAWRQADLNSHEVPLARGGHQMCVDEKNRRAYLFGGWDGTNNLGDLWMYSMVSGQWTCISSNTQEQGGPSARSCHAMCFDGVHQCIYVMGKYVNREFRRSTDLENNLYCYDTLNDEWIVLSENTEVQNGPRLLFNTQMVFDPRFCCIYVYGGKVLLADTSDSTTVYSGLYRYDLRAHRWTRLKADFHMLEQEQHVRGRYFHSMTIDPDLQRLYILSSKRDVTTPGDIFIYDIAADTFYEKMEDLASADTARQPMTQQRYLSEQQRCNPAYSAVQTQPPMQPSDTNDHHPHHVHLVQDGRTIRMTLDSRRQELYVLVSVQNDGGSHASSPPMQNLMSMRGMYGLQQIYQYAPPMRSQLTSARSIQSAGAGFHPCSSLMDSGVRYESGYYGQSSATGTESGSAGGGNFQKKAQGGAKGYGSDMQRSEQQVQMPPEHILMVVFCYHIPTETWTEVYSSAQASAAYASAAASATGSLDDSDSGSSAPRSNSGYGHPVPPFPAPRFAQDWAYDSVNGTHYMFGGNPNRPNNKTARYNDTWGMQLTRPDSRDILRRVLCLVRQRRFLDMCAGLEQRRDACAQERPECQLDPYKASAIPSPKAALLDRPATPPSPLAKRSSSLAVDGEPTEHMGQRQKKHVRESPVFPSETDSAAAATNNSRPQSNPLMSSAATDTCDSTAQALEYLQRCVAPLVKHNDPTEYQAFHALSTALFQIKSTGYASQSSLDELRKARVDVYEALLAYFPEHKQQPSLCLDSIVMNMLN
ncbi:hypothetical protein GGI07_001604 [Coemansia sp. Benny D115]|nr:hypothetical protein GGI07_001604 [Coemansia sp. Benny D115]